MQRRVLAGAVLALSAAAGWVAVHDGRTAADAESATPTLKDDFSFGDHWYGPELTLEDLEGRVVLVEDWGYN